MDMNCCIEAVFLVQSGIAREILQLLEVDIYYHIGAGDIKYTVADSQ